MNADRLLANFDRIADAPDAIPKLRKVIFELAVNGSLVDQNLNDSPAGVLEPAPTKSHRGRVQHNLEVDDKWPHALPPTWRWCRLGRISLQITDGEHATPPRIPEPQVPLVTAKNVRDGFMDYGNTDWVAFETAKKAWGRCRPQVGDILLVCVGATTGRLCVLREAKDMVLVRSVALIRPTAIISVDYLSLALRSPMCQGEIWGKVKITAQPCLYINRISSLPIPLPPLPEQHRIVAKVDELMALCDRLEAAQTERERRRDQLTAASLNRLNQGADSDEFREHARFHLHHLSRLTTRPEQISGLRQTILKLAVRGRLISTSNWPTQPEPLQEFASLQNGYAFKSEWFTQSGIRLLRNANVSHGRIDWADSVHLPLTRAVEFERFQLNKDDIVLSLDRPFIVTGTKVARVRPEDLPCLLLQRVGRFQPNLQRLSPEYLFLWLHSPHFTDQMDPGRSNGVPHISSRQVEAAEIFVPSLANQHRIVAKVDELMAVCDQLEAQLTTTQTESRRFLEAVLHKALSAA